MSPRENRGRDERGRFNGSQPRIDRRPQLGDEQKKLMLVAFLRSETHFPTVKDQLHSHHFSGPADRPKAIVWAAAKQFHEDHGQLPTVAELRAEVRLRVDGDNSLDNYDIDDLNEFFDVLEYMDDDQLNLSTAMKWASRLLQDSLYRETQDMLRGEVAVDLPSLLRQQAEISMSIASLASDEADAPFRINSIEEFVAQPPAVTTFPTGCDFIDDFMGGQVDSEVYGIAAPYGVGKTLLAVQLAVARSKWEQSEWHRNGCRGLPPRVYLAVWEESVSSLQVRALANWAEVDREVISAGVLANMSTGGDLSTLKRYEQAKYADLIASGKRIRGERERLDAAIKKMSRSNPECNLRFLDFTGADPKRVAQGAEMAKGVAQAIQADQMKNGNPGVSMVVVDHANAAAECRIDYHGLDPSRVKRHLVGNFPKSLKQNIANPFACPVWAMHQLNTESQRKGLGVMPKITDFAEAKNYAEYCDFVFIMGAKTDDELCIMVCLKHRRAEQKRPVVVRIDGLMCAVRSTGNTFRIDNCFIVPASDYGRYAVDGINDNDASRASLIRSDGDIGI